ncbi:MAG: hypothetical protein JO107_02270 [Hyphomicrobiales bacterium]|nr:hypothetical protein [Hyphomicrobiales bacterium]
MTPTPSDWAALRRAAAYALALVAATLFALEPDWLDRPLARGVNDVVARLPEAQNLAFALISPTVQTVAVGLLAWVCWRSGKEDATRARLASGAVAAVLAAVAAQCLNLALPTPPKPIFDPAAGLRASPLFADVDALSESASHSFPSARATLFAGLAIAVTFVRPRLGAIALGCTLALELGRIALGLHYPADIAASFALAAAFVQLAQMRFAAAPGGWLVRWEGRSPLTFYLCVFLACWRLTDRFHDVRDLAAQLIR